MVQTNWTAKWAELLRSEEQEPERTELPHTRLRVYPRTIPYSAAVLRHSASYLDAVLEGCSAKEEITSYRGAALPRLIGGWNLLSTTQANPISWAGTISRKRRLEDVLSQIQRDCALSVAGDEELVEAYLHLYPQVRGTLASLCSGLHEAFPHATLLMSLADYPNDPHLRLLVRVPNYETSFMDRLSEIRDRYDEELSNSPAWIHVTTDFAPAA